MTIARFTSADLERLPDLPGVRYEIIDGELHVSRAPELGHQFASGEVFAELRNWNKRTGLDMAYAVPRLVFADDDDVIPDVVWISRTRQSEAVDEKGHFRLAPELVVEILSPGRANEFRDRELKLALYSRREVQEYWIVDWQGQTVEVYRRGAMGLERVAVLTGPDNLTSPLLPGFSCPVAQLWMPPAS